MFLQEKANPLHSLNIQKLLQISADQPEAYKTYCLNKQFGGRIPDLFLKSKVCYFKRETIMENHAEGGCSNSTSYNIYTMA